MSSKRPGTVDYSKWDNIGDSSSSEDSDQDDYNTRFNPQRMMAEAQLAGADVHRASGYLPTTDGGGGQVEDIPWAQAVPTNSTNNYQTVEATSVTTLPSTPAKRIQHSITRRSPRKSNSIYASKPLSSGEVEDDSALQDIVRKFCNAPDKREEGEAAMDMQSTTTSTFDGEQPPAAKKKKKKKGKKKKKKKKAKPTDDGDVDMIDDASSNLCEEMSNLSASPKGASTFEDAKPKAKSSSNNRSISFGTVSVREYARTLGEHVVPADGGFPLGLSNELISDSEHPNDDKMCISGSTPPSSPGRNRARSRSDSIVSPSMKHMLDPSYPSSWSVDDFQCRKQTELKERYSQLIREQRKRTFEKEWEKKHHSHHFKQSTHNTRKNRGRSRSGSFSGSNNNNNHGGGGRSNSGSMNMKQEMSTEEKEELERILSQPITIPEGELETRPYDYKKKICHALKSKPKQKKSKQKNGSAGNYGVGQSDAASNVTEEDELYHRHGGRNPLFSPMKEEDRRKVLLRDDHLQHCQVINESNLKTPSKKTRSNVDTQTLDPSDTAVTQHIQHDLETLRINRGAENLGCSCRKLHIFLPGSTDKSHHKKKGSHRRLPERKVKEELRKRGLLNKGNESMSRETMEKKLHDAIEKEPCCWGNDCPCVRDGIGCQADTCSCWHASHDVAHHNGNGTASSEDDVEMMKSRCGNTNGLYVVNLDGIAKHRALYVTPTKAAKG